ncbi:MAG: hypothetical protein KKE44_22215 [Proteobacteria bacterium]|nr:hypothetical protein [Pseudomonadota bacterium]MBU1585451.1 hypothetical protein [Pseudomonadota bacterium]MBU2630015.1 hypothetical protein [Pseudomonadota bacterium]
MNDLICPACGDENLTKSTIKETIKEPFAGTSEIDIVNYSCDTCGFEGDIFKENEKALQKSLDDLKSISVKNILESFQRNNYSFSGIERALEIPQRTFSKWKTSNNKPSASVVALLRYLHLFPWLIEVAERKYDPVEAQRIHVGDALQKFVKYIPFGQEDSLKAETTSILEELEIKITVKKNMAIERQETIMDFGYTPTYQIVASE